jgi:hypothetical protein
MTALTPAEKAAHDSVMTVPWAIHVTAAVRPEIFREAALACWNAGFTDAADLLEASAADLQDEFERTTE